MSRIASVLLPMPLPEAFDYAEPEGMGLSVGDHVAVPLGPRVMRGVVERVREGTGGNRPLKPVLERMEDPPLPEKTLAFVSWAARYAVDAPGQPLAIALRGLRAPMTIRHCPETTASHTRRRRGGVTPECHSAGSAPKRSAKRAITDCVSAISGSRTSTWASGSAASAAATVSR